MDDMGFNPTLPKTSTDFEGSDASKLSFCGPGHIFRGALLNFRRLIAFESEAFRSLNHYGLGNQV